MLKNQCKRMIILISGLCLAFSALAVDQKQQGYSVVDYLGRELTLATPAKRIVAMAPHIVENIYSAGAGHLIVGATDYADYPNEAKKIPRIGLSRGVSIETIIALKPDLVIAWSSGLSSKKLKKIIEFGIPVYFDGPKKLADIVKSIQDIGTLTGSSNKASASTAVFLNKLSSLKQTYKGKGELVSVFYQVWSDPLQTLNKDSIVSDVIELCGGRNIFADGKVIAPVVGIESVIARNPEVIVTSHRGDEFPESLRQWQKWPAINAVSNHNLFYIHPDILLRHTVRLLDGASQLCRQLETVRSNK